VTSRLGTGKSLTFFYSVLSGRSHLYKHTLAGGGGGGRRKRHENARQLVVDYRNRLKYRKSRLRDVRTDLYRRSPIHQHMSYSIPTRPIPLHCMHIAYLYGSNCWLFACTVHSEGCLRKLYNFVVTEHFVSDCIMRYSHGQCY
jgi:hypothetical protein